jgi:hypothetical protein
MRIAIGLPSTDSMYTDSVISLLRLVMSTKEHEITVINQQGCYIDKSRNVIVMEAMKFKADYLLFLDSDMEIPPDTIRRLLAHNKDIIGCNYMRRKPPFSPIAIDKDKKNIEFGRKGIESVNIVPTGVLLINMDIFSCMRYPWFDCEWRDGIQYGEDTRFCAKTILGGVSEIWCDHDLSAEINHIGVFKYNLSQTEGMVLNEGN